MGIKLADIALDSTLPDSVRIVAIDESLKRSTVSELEEIIATASSQDADPLFRSTIAEKIREGVVPTPPYLGGQSIASVRSR